MLRRLPPLVLAKLLDAFNCLWLGRRFPEEWRQATVFPVLKPGKTDASRSDYRPIPLTSSVSKLFERMACRRLSWTLERNHLFNPVQCGFRQDRSTIDHLVTLNSCVRARFLRGHHVGAIFFDIEKAFDTTWQYELLSKLHPLGIRGNMGEFVRNSLTNRTFRVGIGNSL